MTDCTDAQELEEKIRLLEQSFMDQADENEKLRAVSRIFDLLGTDPDQNIDTIVRRACEVLFGACSLYNRLDDRSQSLVCWAGYNLPPDLPKEDTPAGHICYEATIKGENRTVIIEDLEGSPYEQSDPNVSRYGLQSYIGFPITCGGEAIGSLCVVDTRKRKFSETDVYVMTTLAKAVSLEEERKRAQEMLRRKREEYFRLYKLLRRITDNVPDLIWAKDLEDRYIFANQAICDRLLKCDRPDEAQGRTDMDFADRERSAGHEHTFGEICINSDAITRKRQQPGRFLEEGSVRGEHLILDVHKAPFWDENGQMIGTVGCGRDVTREKETEAALRDSESRYRALYSHSPVMMMAIDPAGVVIAVSDQWLDTMGCAREEVIGEKVAHFLTPDSRHLAETKVFPKLLREGRIQNAEFRMIKTNGQTIDVRMNAVVERDDDGGSERALAFLLDITRERQDADERQTLQNRLQMAQKMEAVATLAGGIAHQFNNNLSVITGHLDLLELDGMEDAAFMATATQIRGAARRMTELTDQLLAYARGGKYGAVLLSANRFVQDTLGLLRHTIPGNVRLETRLEPTVGAVRIDVTQMQAVFAAILANAVEAMPEGGEIALSSTVQTVSRADAAEMPGMTPGDYVLLSVADTGKGMADAVRQRIFDPFFSTKLIGRGLGMAAVYGIIKNHGGWIGVESGPDQGTAVHLYLPTQKAGRAT